MAQALRRRPPAGAQDQSCESPAGDDRKWNQRTELLKLLSPEQFAEALKTNLRGRWLWRFAATHSRELAGGLL